ncbi:hypothetical protein [Silvimonas soli]|uniref:hypothetical protein n=1 Tax=Silvimonas soli TaxID=2980100 RepID=UPI0024B398B0|nr:hypothetical protein [Silvimonas soli]
MKIRFHWYVALLLALLVAGCGSSPVASAPIALAQARAEVVAANRGMQRHEWDSAIAHWQLALRLYSSVDNWGGQGEARLGLANAYAMHGQRNLARNTLTGMLDQTLFSQAQRTQAAYQLALLALPDTGAAVSYLKQSQTLCAGQCALVAQLTNLEARIQLTQGNAAVALALAQTVLAHPEGIPESEQAHAWRLVAESKLQLADSAGGWLALQQALTIDRKIAVSEYLADDLLLQKRLGKAMPDKAVEDDAQMRLQSLCAAVPAQACTAF